MTHTRLTQLLLLLLLPTRSEGTSHSSVRTLHTRKYTRRGESVTAVTLLLRQPPALAVFVPLNRSRTQVLHPVFAGLGSGA